MSQVKILNDRLLPDITNIIMDYNLPKKEDKKDLIIKEFFNLLRLFETLKDDKVQINCFDYNMRYINDGTNNIIVLYDDTREIHKDNNSIQKLNKIYLKYIYEILYLDKWYFIRIGIDKLR